MATGGSSSGINLEGSSSGSQYRSGEPVAEWRSSERVENGTPSTSPPYWDSDEEDDAGPKPSELYIKHTWKIEKFSEINKRELKSDVFDIGGYKWYILIYPQGCDVCNHLSLFLCVANHDKLLPGWSHFAQFTIAVVNKEPKKSKYSDTLHRFWKKEHDWGWKKFIEISKLWDGFVDEDSLIIKAQVQVLRERAERPFRCLDILYRRELLRIYLGNVVQICRPFLDEKRGRMVKLIEDKARWQSFRSFWQNMDKKTKDSLSKEKADAILPVVVKQFFVEKEVSSTLVMDSLYSGLRALKAHTKDKKGKQKSRYSEEEDYLCPMILMEKDKFVLIDDVLPLIEMAAMEAMPVKDVKGAQRQKDENGPQNRAKGVDAVKDLSRDTIEHDERRLTELGRRTIEIFVLAHIFSKIEIKHQEIVALRKQEELIQEEAAWLAGNEQKGKRGASEKEKKSKKKQDKQKRNNRKAKDKSRKNEQPITTSPFEEELLVPESGNAVEKSDAEENISTANDSLESVYELVQTGTKDADAEIAQLDSSSDSFSEVVRRKAQNGKTRKSVSKEKNHQRNELSDSADWCTVGSRRASKAAASPPHTAVSSSQDTVVEKEEKSVLSSTVEPCTNPSPSLTSPPSSGSKSGPAKEVSNRVKKPSKDGPKSGQGSPETQKVSTPEATEKPADYRAQISNEKPPLQPVAAKPGKPSTVPVPVISRPSSAPIASGPRPFGPSVSTVQSNPALSSFERDAAANSPSYVPHSYRNAVFGGPSPHNGLLSYAQATSHAGSPMMVPHGSDGLDPDPFVPGFSFGIGPMWTPGTVQKDNHSRNLSADNTLTLTGGIPRMHSFDPRFQPNHRPFEFSAQGHVEPEDFPHIDIINELLDDEQHGFGRLSVSSFGHRLHSVGREFGFPGEVSSGPGPSAGPDQFGGARSYHDANGLQHGYQHGYGGSRSSYDMIPPPFQPPRQPANGPPDPSGHPVNRWQPMNEDNNGYVFRPS